MAKGKTDDSHYSGIASAIRDKVGTDATYLPSEMEDAILSIKTSSFNESKIYSQVNPVAKAFLADVTYDPSDYSNSKIDDYARLSTAYRKDQPSGVEFSTESGELYVFDTSSNRGFSDTTGAGTYCIYNVTPGEEGGNYLIAKGSELIVGGKIIPTGSLRMIKCPNAWNVRDLGGWVCDGGEVKYGLLFRGGEVVASDKSVLVDFLGIRHDVNLRGNQEATWTVSPLGKDVHFYVYDNYAWYSIRNSNLLKSILTDIFDAVIHGEPVYFHCSAGADRTATVALILEALLGMSQSDMDKDYELTCFYTGVGDDNQARRRNEAEWTGLINSFSSFSGDTFRDKVVSWVLSLGITIEIINAFRSAMIDGTPEELTFSADTYSVTNTLTNSNSDNTSAAALQYQPYQAEIKPQNGFVIDSVSIKMNGEDITSQVWDGVRTNFNHSVKNTLVNCSTDNNRIAVISGQSYGATITPNDGYTHKNAEISIKMGGTEMPEYYSNGKITIPKVTGNIEITVTAKESAPAFVNQILTSTDASGNVVGLIKDKRYNSSDALVDASGIDACGFISIKTGDVVRFKNLSFGASGRADYYLRFYDENDNKLGVATPYDLKNSNYPTSMGGSSERIYNIQYDANHDIIQFTVGTTTSIGAFTKMRMSWTSIPGATAIITVNEEIVN